MDMLQQEIKKLQHERKINRAHTRLFEKFIDTARSSREQRVLSATMRQFLIILCEFSGAQTGSIFLLDSNGIVTDSILTQDDVSQEKRSSLIGSVLESGLAGWVKRNLQPGLITDTKTDDRWITLKSQSYATRSALAVPVLRHDELFGIITLMHPEPSHFNETTINPVQQAANQMAMTIENAKLYRELEKTKQAVEKYSNLLNFELEQGKKIQNDFLPSSLPEVSNCDIAAFFKSALQLSGDFYDVFELPGGQLAFVVGDVSGKGVGSALFMALTRSLLRIFSGAFFNRSELLGNRDLLDVVSMINEYLAAEHGDDGMFVTLIFGVLNTASGVCRFINAGHEPVMIIDKNGIKQELNATGPVLGVIPEADWDSHEIRLEKGDVIFGYTDGVTEARSSSRELFTRRRLEALMEEGPESSVELFLEQVKKRIVQFTANAPQSDDITMLAVRWDPAD